MCVCVMNVSDSWGHDGSSYKWKMGGLEITWIFMHEIKRTFNFVICTFENVLIMFPTLSDS